MYKLSRAKCVDVFCFQSKESFHAVVNKVILPKELFMCKTKCYDLEIYVEGKTLKVIFGQWMVIARLLGLKNNLSSGNHSVALNQTNIVNLTE